MQLTQKALTAINNPKIRMKIGLALGISEQAVIKAIKNNSDSLTKYAAMQVIKNETPLKESEIVESINQPA